MSSRITKRFLIFLILPVAALGWFLYANTVDVPYFDEWDLAPRLLEISEGQGSFDTYWEPHEVHRHAVPIGIQSAAALLWGWNVAGNVAIGFILLLIGLPGVIVLTLRSFEQSDRSDSVFLVAIVLAYMSFSQYETLLWGWAIGWTLTVTLVIWIVVLLDGPAFSPVRFLIAIVLSLLASASVAPGLAIWIAAVPLVWARAPENRRLIYVAVWSITAGLFVWFYLVGYHRLPGDESLTASTSAIFVLASLGSSLSREITGAILIGGSMLGLAVFGFLKGSTRWLPIALFVLGFSLMSAIGRAEMGVEQALTSRYLSTTRLFPIALLGMLIENDGSLGSAIRRPLAWLMILAAVVGSLTVVPLAIDKKGIRTSAKLCLETIPLMESSAGTCHPAIYWDEESPIEWSRQLDVTDIRRLPDMAEWRRTDDPALLVDVETTNRWLNLRGRRPDRSEGVVVGLGSDHEPRLQTAIMVEAGAQDDEWRARFRKSDDFTRSLTVWILTDDHRAIRLGRLPG